MPIGWPNCLRVLQVVDGQVLDRVHEPHRLGALRGHGAGMGGLDGREGAALGADQRVLRDLHVVSVISEARPPPFIG